MDRKMRIYSFITIWSCLLTSSCIDSLLPKGKSSLKQAASGIISFFNPFGSDSDTEALKASALALGDEFLVNLKSDLKDAGLTDEQATIVVSSASSELGSTVGALVIGANLTDVDLSAVGIAGPAIVAGAIKALDELGLDDGEERAGFAGKIIESTFQSLDGNLSDLDDEGVASLSQNMVGTAVTKLTEADLGDKNAAYGVKAITNGAIGKLESAGIATAKALSVTQAVVTGAMTKLPDLKLSKEFLTTAVQGVSEGAVSALTGAGIKKNDLSQAIRAVAATSVKAFKTDGFDRDAVMQFTGAVAAGAVVGVSNIKQVSAQEMASGDFINVAMTGCVGALQTVGFKAAEVASGMGNITKLAIGAMGNANIGADFRNGVMAKVSQGVMTGFGDAGIASTELVQVAMMEMAKGATESLSTAGFGASELGSAAKYFTEQSVVYIANIGITNADALASISSECSKGVMMGYSKLANEGHVAVANLQNDMSHITNGALNAMTTFKSAGFVTQAQFNNFGGAVAGSMFEGLAYGGIGTANLQSIQSGFTTLFMNSLTSNFGVIASELTAIQTSFETSALQTINIASSIASGLPTCATQFPDTMADADFFAKISTMARPILCAKPESEYFCPKFRIGTRSDANWINLGFACDLHEFAHFQPITVRSCGEMIVPANETELDRFANEAIQQVQCMKVNRNDPCPALAADMQAMNIQWFDPVLNPPPGMAPPPEDMPAMCSFPIPQGTGGFQLADLLACPSSIDASSTILKSYEIPAADYTPLCRKAADAACPTLTNAPAGAIFFQWLYSLGKPYFPGAVEQANGDMCIYLASGTGSLQAMVMSGSAPYGESNTTILAINIAGYSVSDYKYKLGSSSTTMCSDSVGYSAAVPVTQKISDSIVGLADGGITLCVVGGDSSGNWQPYSSYTMWNWTKDTTAPTAPSILKPTGTVIEAFPLVEWGNIGDASHYEMRIGIYSNCSDNFPVQLYYPGVYASTHSMGSMNPLTPGNYFACVQAFDRAGNYSAFSSASFARSQWLATPISGLTVRRMASSVWTGGQMIVWGGWDGGTVYFSNGAAFDPFASSWTSLPTTGAPTGRYGHVAVWADSKMIIWGGYNGTAKGDGARYDLSAWSAVSTTGAPVARKFATAVSTGSKVIVWGGTDGTNTFNSGGIYDPAGNTWSATSVTGAPGGAYEATSVWTGTLMIVWGGSGTTAQVNTGGIYNPANEATTCSPACWTATSTATGVPAARTGHVAVWAGTKMIIWGGKSGASTYYGDGALFDPANNSWTVISAINAPSARAGATSVWIDGRMLVWGGYNSTSSFGDGGIYNPATDSWTTLNTFNAPSMRREHTAVAGGYINGAPGMIVWGGYNNTANYNDGGIFHLDPSN